jgi:hypothetical protein
MFMISSLCRAHLADRPADRVVEVSGSLRPAADGARLPVPSAPVVVVGFCALQACQDVIHLRFTNRHDLGVKSPSTAITLGHGVMANRASQTSRLTSRTQALLSGRYHGGIWLPHVALSKGLSRENTPVFNPFLRELHLPGTHRRSVPFVVSFSSIIVLPTSRSCKPARECRTGKA